MSASKRTSSATTACLAAAVIILLILRHDYWNWSTPAPLLFGFLPVGLWWQVAVTLAASVLMWAMVRLVWPGHLEDSSDHN